MPVPGPGSFRDRFLSIGSLALYAVPGFWLGLVLIVVFAVDLRWLPIGGIETLASDKTGLDRAADIAIHLILPVAALGFIYLALYLRMMRAGMAEAWRQDFVLAARARGLSRRRIVVAHVARNALLPLVTMLGLQSAQMLGGSVVIESVFSVPGLGRLAQEAVASRDTALAARHHPHQRRPGRSSSTCWSTSPMPSSIRASAPARPAHDSNPPLPAHARGSRRCRPPDRADCNGAHQRRCCFPGDPQAIAGPALLPPFQDWSLPLGTDGLGRDVLAELFHGARTSWLSALPRRRRHSQ